MTEPRSFSLEWNFLHQKPEVTAVLKAIPSDFIVIENLGFEPSGEGEHIYLYVRKTGENTAWVAKKLAEFCQLPTTAVSWAGLKDRHAMTEQWFGIHLPGKRDPDFSKFESDTIQILRVRRHHKKLRPGDLKGNHFSIKLHEIEQSRALDFRLQNITQLGVPNYFGEQRFGRDGNNLRQADLLFSGKRVKEHHKRAIYLSAARSYVFNHVVSQKIAADCLLQPMVGECLISTQNAEKFCYAGAGKSSMQDLQLQYRQLVTSGPMWGRGENLLKNKALEWEIDALSDFSAWLNSLELTGMQMDRRPALLTLHDLRWRWLNQSLELQFSLPAGCYATSVIRELIITKENTGLDEDSD